MTKKKTTAQPEPAITDEHRDPNTVIDEVRAAMGHDDLSQYKIAKEAGIKETTLSLVLAGKYQANPKAIIAKLEKWLAARSAKAGSARIMPPARPWTGTPTAERVFAALGYAQTFGDIAVVYGAAGLGKTITAREYARRMPNVWIVTATTATTNSVSMALESVLLALGVRDLPQGAARMEREAVRRMAGSGGLLVVDEAQNLCLSALEEIRALHDATGVGVALLGNEVVYARLTGGNRAAYLDRLFSRIGKRVRLTRADQEDVAAVAAAYGVTAAPLVAVLADIGARAGGLRAVVKTIRLALTMANGTPLNTDHLRAAFRDLEG